MSRKLRRVGIVFAGGPAPAANAVIASAASAFVESGSEVIGFFHGYSNLQEYEPLEHPLLPDSHFRVFTEKDLRGLRNSRGIIIGTARANPGSTRTSTVKRSSTRSHPTATWPARVWSASLSESTRIKTTVLATPMARPRTTPDRVDHPKSDVTRTASTVA